MKAKHIISTVVILGFAAVNSFAALPAEGDLVKGSNGCFYVIQDGKRCAIPSFAVFEAKGYDITKVVDLADAELKAIPQGATITMPYKTAKNGDLVRGTNGPLYLIQDGKRCTITDMAATAMGLKMGKTIVASQDDLEAIPEGPTVMTSYKKPVDGDLVKGIGPCIYVIQGGKRCSIPSPDVLKAKGYDAAKVVTLAAADLEAIPPGPRVTMPYKNANNDDIVTASGPCIYVIQGGKRCPIPTMDVFRAKGYQLEKIIKITDAEMEAIPRGEALSQ